MKAYMRKAGWQMSCSPCAIIGTKAAAGVGIMVREDIAKLIPTTIRTKAFQEAYDKGRAGKYMVDLGWEEKTSFLSRTVNPEMDQLLKG